MTGIRAVVFIVAILAIALLLGVYAYGDAVEGAAPDTDVVGENFTSDPGLVTLDNSELDHTTYDETVVVTSTDEQTTFPAGGNYSWNAGNGTLSVESGSELAGEEFALIDYTYQEPSGDAQALYGLLLTMTEQSRWVLLIGAVVLVFGAARVLAGAGG